MGVPESRSSHHGPATGRGRTHRPGLRPGTARRSYDRERGRDATAACHRRRRANATSNAPISAEAIVPRADRRGRRGVGQAQVAGGAQDEADDDHHKHEHNGIGARALLGWLNGLGSGCENGQRMFAGSGGSRLRRANRNVHGFRQQHRYREVAAGALDGRGHGVSKVAFHVEDHAPTPARCRGALPGTGCLPRYDDAAPPAARQPSAVGQLGGRPDAVAGGRAVAGMR